MKKFLSISEIAQLLSISAPTLRFWEDAGLFKIPKNSNKYRQYSMQHLVQIADIMFYRNLGVPIKEIKKFDKYTIDQYKNSLSDVKKELEEKITTYNAMYKGVLTKELYVREVLALKKEEYIYGDIPFKSVVSFVYTEKDKIVRYTKDASLYIRYIDTKDFSSETRGMVADTFSTSEEKLWEKDENKRYAIFLIKEIVDQNYLSDLEQKLKTIQKKHKTGVLLAQYLLTAVEGDKLIDYLKGYVEID